MGDAQDITAAFVRGSRMAADNLGVTLPEWSLTDDEQSVGRMLLQAFDAYAAKNSTAEGLGRSIRHAIQDEWGLLVGGTRTRRVTVGDVLAHYDTATR